MAGINHLRQVYERKGKEFLDNLLNSFVIINQNIEGTFFGVKKTKENDKFRYFKKSGEITYVDRMLTKYYNPAVAYFESIPEEKRNRIPSNLFFGFEYLTRKDETSSKLSRSPINNLILSYIHKLDDNGDPIDTLQTKEDLIKWAQFLEVEPPQIIFEGRLDDEQRTSILEFVYSTYDELVEKFKTTSFTKYILSILNPENEKEYIKNNIGSDIDSIIFRFYSKEERQKPEVFLAKMIDPIFQLKTKEPKPEKNKPNDYIWLIVIDLMNHIELYDEEELKKICESESDYDQKYIKLINFIFKDFIKEYDHKYDGLTLDIPEYLNRPEFEIDYDMVSDQEVMKLIKNNQTFKEIYRILLNFFRKPRKKATAGFFSPSMMNQLNIQVNKIKRIVMGDAIYEGLFPSFGEFIGEDLNDSYILEAEEFQKKKKSVEPEKVNILIGSFQPINNGHIKAAEKMKENNGLRTVLICIMKPGITYPLSAKYTNFLLNKVQQELSDTIAGVRMVQHDTIKEILSDLKPDFDPILWGSSSRKVKDYVLQLDYLRKKNVPIRLSDSFKLVELPTFQKSDEVIETIKSQDFNKFKDMVPKSIGSEFFNLTKELENSNNS